MLELHTTEAFTGWFQGLCELDAEAVATGVELIGALSPERAPEGSSDMLLWYQSAPDLEQLHLRGSSSAQLADFQKILFEYTRFSSRVRGLLKQLEAPAVLNKLAEVPEERAILALASLRRIAVHPNLRQVWAGGNERTWAEVQALSRSVFEAIGEKEPAAPLCDGLWEWNLTVRKPGLRILYGVDSARGQGLLILGEPLGKCAYGPSVRRALAVWREYLEGSLESSGGSLEQRSAL